jgi:uncharacterized protein (TIGR00269 family)
MNTVETKVARAIGQFHLIEEGDKILCAVSGGKDSTAALYVLNRLYQGVEAITLDASIGDYTKRNLENIKAFCHTSNIKLHIVSFREEFGHSLCYIQSILKSRGVGLSSCAICGVLKRHLLNKKARELKKSVLVTGHNKDDEAQSIIMNIFRGNMELLAKLGPKTGVVHNRKFIQRVKPLYFVSEAETEEYSRAMDFPVVYARCPCTVDSYRNSIRCLLNRYEKSHPQAKDSIVSYFLKNMHALKEKYSEGEPRVCARCGEPCRKDMCKACEIILRMGQEHGKS